MYIMLKIYYNRGILYEDNQKCNKMQKMRRGYLEQIRTRFQILLMRRVRG